MNEIDLSFEVAKAIFATAKEIENAIVSEEDAKIQLITRVLTEVLGWAHKDISAERKNQNGYSDYILSDLEIFAFLVEAKRKGIITLSTRTATRQDYKISGPVLKDALGGIEQAASYCAPEGIQLAVLTDGRLWIIFKPFIPGERYKDKQAIVFPTYDSILSDFPTFFELLSKSHYRKNTYKLIFDRIHENRNFVSSLLRSPLESSDLRVGQKSPLAFDLEQVFTHFFSALAGDDDPDLIINCFVETKESRIADFSLEKITANVLGNLAPNDTSVDEGLNTLIESTIRGELGQTVFIVGPTGAGKSTFLERFFKKTLSRLIRDRCVVISVNALDASGDDRTSINWMTNKIIHSIEHQIFIDGFPSWNDLQALYQGEYIKRSKGVDAQLYKRDKQAFKEKFGLFMEEQVENDREGYLNRLVRDIVLNRKKLPILVIDNTDEFDLSYKEKLFQFCQALRRNANHCLLIFPATDRSAWTFSKTDIFNIYASKSFFLPTPAPREVFRKRVDYLKEKLTAIGQGKTKAEYLIGHGIKISINNLEGFAAVVENIFVDQDFAAKRIGELSNYNIRKTLLLSKRVITSAYLDIEDILKSYIVGQIVTPSQIDFMNALLRGDYNVFKQDDDHVIFSMFQVDSEIRQSPLVHLRILILLQQTHFNSSDDEHRYLPINSIYRYFDVMGMSEVSIERSLASMIQSELIEPYDLSSKSAWHSQKLAITYCGLAHVEMALFNAVYFEQMAMTTRMVDLELVGQIRGILFSNVAHSEKMKNVVRLFAQYLFDEDTKFVIVPEKEEFAEQSQLRGGILGKWTKAQVPNRDKRDSIEVRAEHGLVAKDVIATVDWFDWAKGFGFVKIPTLNETAFIHQKTISASDIDELHDGDDIRCDVGRGSKGLFVSGVRNISSAPSEAQAAVIVRLFPDRGYGFVHVPATGNDAFFHYSVFSDGVRATLKLGDHLRVNVKADKSGTSFQVKRVIEYRGPEA